ncbi:hypothetical protein KY334_01010, partial [Candidatus Woesearchaeota archaeon]|nr:hypothetical protein [Candidatus Woesearchaeota archaeon]
NLDNLENYKNMNNRNFYKLIDLNKLDFTKDYANLVKKEIEKKGNLEKLFNDYKDLIEQKDVKLQDLAYNLVKDYNLNKLTSQELYKQIQGLDKKSDFEEFIEEYVKSKDENLFNKGLKKLYVKDSKSKSKLYPELDSSLGLYKYGKTNLEDLAKDYLDNEDANGNYKFGNDSDKDKMLCPSCLRMVAKLMPSGVCKDCDDPGCGGNNNNDDYNNRPPGGGAGMMLLN